MSIYVGDFPTSHTAVCFFFDTFAAATGAPTATTNFAAGDILIFKDGSTTQRSSSSGITVSTSFDTNTGLQFVLIDLSDNTDAGFYAAGHEYSVAVADITADGQTLRFWLGAFSIERAGGVLALIKGNAIKVDVNTIKTQAVTCAGGVTIPAATLASTTNITAGTITTTTNLTNAVASVTGAVGSVTGNVGGNVTGSVGSVVGAVGSVTGNVGGNVTGSVGSLTTNNDKTGYALTSGERTSVADALLDRDMSLGTDSGSASVRTPRQAFRFNRNKWAIAGNVLTVTKEDDTTTSWTATVTTTTGNPVDSMDP